MTHDEMIAVIAAHRDGKMVQARIINGAGPWSDQTIPIWNLGVCDYRVKPVVREWWLVPSFLDREKFVCFTSKPANNVSPIHVIEVLPDV